MLPRWRDEIAIRFAPGELVLTRIGRGIRPRCTADTRGTVKEFLLADWRPALAVLDGCLSDPAWQGANVRIVLSNHWARYAIVPWASDIKSEDERLAHARICLEKVYGHIDHQWIVSISDAPPGRARVASAIQRDLLDGLRATVHAHNSRLASVQPQLIVSYNGWLPRLADVTGWFVNIDEGSLAAARLDAGGWDRVYSARIGTNWSLELDRLRTFGRLAAKDSVESRVFVAAPDWLRDLASDGDDDGIEWLHDDAPGASAAAELALLRRLYA